MKAFISRVRGTALPRNLGEWRNRRREIQHRVEEWHKTAYLRRKEVQVGCRNGALHGS